MIAEKDLMLLEMLDYWREGVALREGANDHPLYAHHLRGLLEEAREALRNGMTPFDVVLTVVAPHFALPEDDGKLELSTPVGEGVRLRTRSSF